MEKMKLNIQLFGASASVQSSKYDGRYLKLTVTETETSIENNTSTIYWKFESIGGSSSYYTIYNYGVYVNGSQVYDGTSGDKTKNYSNHSLPVTKGSKDGYVTIQHNADGTAADISFSLHGKVYKSGTETHNGTLALTTIPRASQPTTSSSVTMGNAVTINTNRYSSSFTHTLTYAFGGTSGTIGTNVGESVSWTPPLTLANQIPSATSGVATITCVTYSNGVAIGTKTTTITLNVPTSVVPTISSLTLQENGDVPSSWGVYVQNKSKIKVTYSASGSYSSTISSYTTTGDGYTYSGNPITTNYIRTTGNITLTGKVVDSRGRQATKNETRYIYPYSNPTILTAQVQRCDENGNIDSNGEYCWISYSASISSCNNKNKTHSHYLVGFKISYASDYSYVALTTNVDNYSASGMLYADGIFAADRGIGSKLQFSNLLTYDIQFYVDDTFASSVNVQKLDTGFDLMNFNASGKAMAIGKVSEADANQELLEVGMDTSIYGYLRLYNQNNGVLIGDLNSSYIHFYSDQNKPFYFNRSVEVNGELKANGGWERYSTNEIPIGKWIDNRTIYRKVLTFTFKNANQWNDIAHNISGIYQIINYKTTMYYALSGYYYEVPNDVVLETRLNNTYYGYYFNNANMSNNATGVVVMEYTK